MKLTKVVIHTLVIFVVFSLVIQPISSTNAQVPDERKNAEDVTKKIQADLDQAKATLKITKKAWKDAKVVTDNAKSVYQQNPSNTNLDAFNQAKQFETNALQTYKKSLEKVLSFKPDITPDVVEKAQKSTGESAKKSEDRVKSKEITKKIQEDLDKEKVILFNAKNAWKNAKNATDFAKIAYQQNSSNTNLDAFNQAKQFETNALQTYKNILKKVQAFKPDITPDVIEKSQKSTGESKDSKSEERKKSEAKTLQITNQIQLQLNVAESTLKNSFQTWNSTKVTKDLARQIYYQNPTNDNLDTLNQAKKDEAVALFFYHKAINDVKFYKAKLNSNS